VKALRRSLLLFLVLAAASSVAACTGAIACSMVGPARQVVGLLLHHSDATATFRVESLGEPTQGYRDVPQLQVGGLVTVTYWDGTAQFLRNGDRYSVGLFWIDGATFESTVHTADKPCSFGTTYADGRAIDTSLWARPSFRRGLIVVAAAVMVLSLFVLFVSRRRRRERGSAEVQRLVPGERHR